MNNPKELRERNFPTAGQDAEAASKSPLYGGPDSSYALAFTDTDFLLDPEMRPVRMQLELLKPELIQREENIESTIVVFGSARIQPADVAQAHLDEAEALPPGSAREQAIRVAKRHLGMSAFMKRPAASPAWSPSTRLGWSTRSTLSPAVAPASWRRATAARTRSAARASA